MHILLRTVFLPPKWLFLQRLVVSCISQPLQSIKTSQWQSGLHWTEPGQPRQIKLKKTRWKVMQLKCNVKHWDLKRRFKVVWRCITTTTTTIIIIIINYIELLFIIIVLLFFYFLGSLLQSRRHENLALTGLALTAYWFRRSSSLVPETWGTHLLPTTLTSV